MSLRDTLQKMPPDKLKELAGLCGGMAFLVALVVVFSGAAPFEPPSLRLALQNITGNSVVASVAYWESVSPYAVDETYGATVTPNIGYYPFPAPINCSQNYQNGGSQANCTQFAGGVLSANVVGTNVSTIGASLYDPTGYSCNPGYSWYFAGAGTSTQLVVKSGKQVELDWSCEPNHYASEYLACGDGWRAIGGSLYTAATMTDSNGTTYPSTTAWSSTVSQSQYATGNVTANTSGFIGSTTITANWAAGTTKYYRLYCTTGGTPQLNATVPIIVTTASIGLNATPSSIPTNSTSTLAWNVSNASQCTLTTPQGGEVGAQGLGTDESVNAVAWTPVNLTSADQLIDTPTDNFATLNQIYYYSPNWAKGAVQAGGLASNGGFGAVAGWQLTSGKWYWEYTIGGVTAGYPIVGVWEDPSSGYNNRAYPGQNNDTGYGYSSQGYLYYDSYYSVGNPPVGTTLPTLSTFTNGDVIGVAYDANTGKIYFSKNGVWQNSANPVAGTGYVGIVQDGWPGMGSYEGKTYINFGQVASSTTYYSAAGGYFAYSPPSGFVALSTNNLPAPAVANPSQYFSATTYTGNGAAQNVTTGFQPDLVWIKNRIGTYLGTLTDSTRGTNSDLFSSSPAPANANDPNGWVSALSAQGFTAGGQCTATPNNTNLAGDSYIAWAWKKSPTDGVDIVSYTGNGASSRQLAHALGTVPQMVVVKRADGTGDWYVWTSGLTDQSYFLKLDTTDGQTNSNSPWGGATSGNFTSSYFTVGANSTNNLNATGAQYVAYIFSSRTSFSQIGTYVGNGSTDGPFINTGFNPEFVLVKRIDTTGGWNIWDSARGPTNPINATLYPNLSNVESGSGGIIDFLSNGFKLRYPGTDYDASGGTYMYMAFADQPFSVANAPATTTIANSLRLDASQSNAQRMDVTRTPASTGNRQAWTVSMWVKRGALSGQYTNQVLFSGGGTNNNNTTELYFNGSDNLVFGDLTGGSWNGYITTTAVYRDPSAWLHIVAVWDSTNSNPADELRLYVNNVRQSVTINKQITQNLNSNWNTAGYAHNFGVLEDMTSQPLDGEIADVYSIDGQALTPSSFGAYDGNGNWRPAVYGGSYGTNGFHLTFTNGLQLGADSSGLNNNFTANNISTLDQVIDTPTNNFATLNEIYYYTASYNKGVVEGGGLASAGNYGAATGWQLNSGLWYWEYTAGGVSSGYPIPGIWETPMTPNGSQSAYPGYIGDTGFGYQATGYVTSNNIVQPQVVSGYQNGDVVGVAYNANTGAMYVSKNGQWQNGTNLIPQMTGCTAGSNSCTTGGVTISASTFYTTGDEPWRAADRNSNGSYWYTYSHVPSPSSPDWLQVNFGSSPQTVASYSIQNYNGAVNSYDPINFQLQGSTNGSTWTTLDTETNVGWPVTNDVQYFTVPSANRGSYQYYRLYVTGAGGVNIATGYLIINEFGLYSSATQSPADGSVQPIGYTTGGWPGLGSYYGKTYINFGQGGGQDTSFADSSSYNRSMSAYGEVVATTTTAKFTASAYFNGSGELSTPQIQGLTPSGNYTIDLWARPSSASASGLLFVQDSGSGYSPYLLQQSGNSFLFYGSSVGSGWDIASAQTICSGLVANTWYHLAVVRSGNTYYTFCNGVQTATWTSSATPWPNNAPISIGGYNSRSTFFTGYIDEVRFSNIARWTSNFTPPTSPYTSDANTLLLLHLDNGTSNFYRSSAGGYFAYPPPSGYLALSTNNMTAPTITQPSNYFNAVAYSGTAGIPSYDNVNKGVNVVLSNGDYDATSQTNSWTNDEFYSTNTFSSGKYYAEFKMASNYPVAVGIADASKSDTNYIGTVATDYSFVPWNNCFYNNAVCTAIATGTAVGDVYMVAVDMNAGKIWFGKNGVWENSGNPATGANPQYTGITGTKAFAVSAYAGAGAIHAAFGEAGEAGTSYYSSAGGYFFYQPPSGFLALPAGSSQNISLNFQPDLVWVKNRIATYANTLVDSARGAGINLFSNTSGAQVTGDINGSTMSFNSNGFTVGGACAAPTGNVNAVGNQYIAWSFKKSPSAGFDIESYTGTGSSTQSIADSLGTAPSFIITKNINAPGDWYVGGAPLGGGYATLDTTNASSVTASAFGTDLIPTMTAATTNGVTISASTYYNNNYPPWYIGDKNINSYWNSAVFATLSATSTQWVQVDFGTGTPKTAGAYTLMPYINSNLYSPTSFTLYGSNDANTCNGTGSTLTALDTENAQWILDDPQTFYIPAANQAAYRCYRLGIAANGGANQALLAELNLWQAPVNSASSFAVENNANFSGNQYIAYLFSNRTGFSQFGTYMANGSGDGPFIYTGFEPAFVMIKDISRNNSYTNWSILDNARNVSNPATTTLFANLTAGDIGGSGDGSCTPSNVACAIDFLSNGFKIRNNPWNTNGTTEPYLYAAFASTPFKSAYTANGYSIPYSLRFDGSKDAYMSRALAQTPTSNQKQTFSAWVKRGTLGSSEMLINFWGSGGGDEVRFESNDTLSIIFDGGTYSLNTGTSEVYRDPSAWIHIVVSLDMTQAPPNNVELYVNGVQQPLSGTYPPQGYTLKWWNAAGTSDFIGSYDGTGGWYFDGEMADVYSVDGQALAPTDFGSYDSNGFWKPQSYTGTYGTNGFRLDFANTSNTNFSTSSGSVEVGPLTQSTTYTLQCTPVEGGLISTTATVNVSSTPGLSLTACNSLGALCSSGTNLPGVVSLGQPASVSWSTSGVDASSCGVTDQFSDNIGSGNSGSNVSTPAITQPTTYTLTCLVNGVSTTTTASVVVNNSCTIGTGTAPSSCPTQCAFDTNTTAPSYAGGATLSWCCPSGPSAGSNFSTGGAVTGSQQVTPQSPTAYTLSCPSGSGNITLNPTNAVPPSTMTLSASRVQRGNDSTLSWNVAGMVSGISCNVTPALPGGMPAWNGNNPWIASATTSAIIAPTLYTLTCGTGTASTSVSAIVPLVPIYNEI